MTTNFLISVAELLRECPMCHKVSIDGVKNKIEISPERAYRRCQCGYNIELKIKENAEETEIKTEPEVIQQNVLPVVEVKTENPNKEPIEFKEVKLSNEEVNNNE